MFRTSIACLLLALLFDPVSGFSQGPVNLRDEQPPIPVEEIILRFSQKESQFRAARANYVYTQDVTVQELDTNDRVRGEFREVTEIYYDDQRRRRERILFAPPNTLVGITLTPQDAQDIREIQPFVLTAEDIEKYNLSYLGREDVDEIGTYVFDVEPRRIERGQRYFQGVIWVDDLDFQIVKTYGKAVPDIIENGQENLFPRFETYREQIDDYWFPTYVRALDTLNFSSGRIRMRQVIRYLDYKKFTTDVILTFGNDVEDPADSPEESRPNP